MQVIYTAIDEVKIIALKAHVDDRGFFCERFRADVWAALGLGPAMLQENYSRSMPGVLRGVHGQHSPQQAKLVGVTRGKIFDVAVDLRPNSPSFMQHVGAELSDENHRMLYVPPGFGHGFCVLGDQAADVLYYVSGYYNAAAEFGVHYADAQLNIAWPLKNPQVSKRDAALPSLAEALPALRAHNALYNPSSAG
jgi:dTDP-4-dehydrorhamnose 3,5-epimerase